MPNGLVAIMKKEFVRFFTDRRMLLTTVLMPGLLIYLVYSFIGSAMTNMFTTDDDYQPSIYAVNLPVSIETLLPETGVTLTLATADETEEIKQRIQDREVDLLVVFPEGFDSTLALRNETFGQAYTPPNIELFYNSTSTTSSTAYGTISSLLEAYKSVLTPAFFVNAGDASYNLATEKDTSASIFASMLPMLMMVFLYSGCIGVAPESIAGEKERGTIATLLVTPLRRWQLALGKVVSLGIMALLAGASSFIGVMLALPKMLNGALSSGGSSGLDSLLYGPTDYLMLLVVILSTVLLFIGLISIISAFARTVREANTMMMPLMILIMLVGVTGMFSQGAQGEVWYYLIPAYNSVQCLVGVFSFTASPLFVAVTVVVNLTLTGICVFVLGKMFNSEKVIFAR